MWDSSHRKVHTAGEVDSNQTESRDASRVTRNGDWGRGQGRVRSGGRVVRAAVCWGGSGYGCGYGVKGWAWGGESHSVLCSLVVPQVARADDVREQPIVPQASAHGRWVEERRERDVGRKIACILYLDYPPFLISVNPRLSVWPPDYMAKHPRDPLESERVPGEEERVSCQRLGSRALLGGVCPVNSRPTKLRILLRIIGEAVVVPMEVVVPVGAAENAETEHVRDASVHETRGECCAVDCLVEPSKVEGSHEPESSLPQDEEQAPYGPPASGTAEDVKRSADDHPSHHSAAQVEEELLETLNVARPIVNILPGNLGAW